MIEDEAIQDSELFGPSQDTLLIIGNGFDLNLGLKTGYSDFVRSDKWPFKQRCSLLPSLGSYLNKKSQGSWFDLESSMANFSSRKRLANRLLIRTESFVKKVYEDDRQLISRLREYLLDAEKEALKIDSIAATILRKSCACQVPATIYSFNYTDLGRIANLLHIETECHPNYVHGTLKDDDIILGFSERADIIPELSFMCKSRRGHYSSTSLFKSISTFKNIIFFGLSLGEIDYCYFEDFFKGVYSGQYDDKHIRIITKDEQSRQNILSNIGKMTGNIFNIMKHSNFKVIRTDEPSDNAEFDELYRILDPQLGKDYFIDC